MKKFLVLAVLSIFLVGSIFSQVKPNVNLKTNHRERIVDRTQNAFENRSRIQANDQLKLNYHAQDQEIEPITVIGTIKNMVESDYFVELVVEIEDETYSLKIPHDLISDIKPEVTIELTGFKIRINDYSYFKPLEIKYQDKTINMIQRKEKFRTQDFESHQRFCNRLPRYSYED